MSIEYTNNLKEHLKILGVQGEMEFSIPPKPEMGDLAFGCFGIAKQEGGNPVEVAKDLEEKFKAINDPLITKVQSFGPYLNFYLNTGRLAEIVLEGLKKEGDALGFFEAGQNQKVLIEYPSNNTHKEFHIGHLRISCIGNALVQIFRKANFNIIPINYINDFGAHVVRCLWGIKKFHPDEIPGDNSQKWLGEVYTEASKYIKEHEEEVRPELDELQQKLEAREPDVMALFDKTRDWSMQGFLKINEELWTRHEKIIYESDIKDKGQAIVDELLEKKIAEVGERGALIINLEKYGLDIALLRKATGAGVYLTSDLALAHEKFDNFDVVESINVTGSEQEFYFKQMFKILELYGFKNKMTHIGCGLVTLPSGKMSSREGNVVLYEDLRDEVKKYLKKEIEPRHADWSEEKVENTALTMALAVLKFTMQKHEAKKVIVFDLQEAVSFEGFSAPYILYAVARINSLERKAKTDGLVQLEIDYSVLKENEEKNLLLMIASYEEVTKKAWQNYNPSVVAKYAFDLAQCFNDFYNKHSVLNTEDPVLGYARLALTLAVRDTIKDALSVLTIETVDEM
ncbi:MAG TPA: arginine--tRNA ligase [Patescibacteria group bacterium]|nr:arginine--tRNA ligase [Patescibacteria group bacterium]